ncbi:MAG: AI-2E family transporter [Acidobacteriota bacterium]|nr:AI-2E family transporter [Acidobacteriota bacterium]
MNLLDKNTLRVIFTILATVALLSFLWLARKPLLVFLFAMLFAYLLEPLIGLLQRWTRAGRGVAIAIVYILLLGGLFTSVAAVGPRVIEEGRRLSQAAPELYNKFASGSIALQVGQARGWSAQTQQSVQQFIVSHRDEVLTTLSEQGAKLTGMAANTLWIVLIPILAVFFLSDKSRFANGIERLFSDPHSRRLVHDVMNDLDGMLSHFVRAQLYLAAISCAVYVTGLSLLHAPYALVLGILGGLLEFIPFVGPMVAGVLILGVAFGFNYPHLLAVLLFLLLWRGVQDYIISPRVLGGRVEVHPLLAIFGVLAGGEIAGVAGIYFAVPVLAAIRILWQRWHERGRAASSTAL